MRCLAWVLQAARTKWKLDSRSALQAQPWLAAAAACPDVRTRPSALASSLRNMSALAQERKYAYEIAPLEVRLACRQPVERCENSVV